MPEVSVHAPGAFCWVELGTTDSAAARQFYSELLGWTTEVSEMPDDMGTYTMLRTGGKEIGGLYELSAEMKSQGVPPHWLPYVNVENADETTNRAEALGAEIKMGPTDVMDIGRMSVLQDPGGAHFAIWQAKTHGGATIVGDPGAVCWHELITNDLAGAKKFYQELFGYELEEKAMGSTSYTMLKNGERREGGIMAVTPEMGEVPSHWMIYIAVNDCEATVEKAKSLGAKVYVPPTDVPGVGRFATFADPQGAVFSVIKL